MTNIETETKACGTDGKCGEGCAQMDAVAHWLLRIAIASVFVFHGVMKFMNWDMTKMMFSDMFGLNSFLTFMVALGEVGGGALILIAGFLPCMFKDIATRLGALSLMPIIIGAIAIVHKGRWNFMVTDTHPMGGMEFQVTLLLILLYLFFRGSKA